MIPLPLPAALAALAAAPGAALRLAPWLCAATALAGALWYRGAWLGCRAEAALETARAEERLAVARTADLTLTRALEARLRPIVNQLQEQSHATSLALARAQSDPRCARTPAAAAFDGSVRPVERPGERAPRPAGAGEPRSARP